MQLDGFDEAPAGCPSACNAKGKDRSRAFGQILLGALVKWAVWQTSIIDPRHQGMLLQPLCHRHGVLYMSLHTQRQGFQPLQKQKGVKWTEARPKVAHHF